MFVSPTSLPHLLAPSDYVSAARYAQELSVMRRTWHVVGTTAELSKEGDFITTDLAGVAVQVRNFAGELRALSNVCSHRHCLISSKAMGNSPRMRCQYHGWEFHADGQTGRIPEPKNFVPFDRDKCRLPCYQVATVGQLVFVNLSPSAPALADFLGHDFFEFLVQRFGEGWKPSLRWHPEYPANWKVPIENSLEAYHVPAVHPHTFKVDPGEDKSEHVLLPHRTSFSAKLPFCPHSRIDAIFQNSEGSVVRWLGYEDTRAYSQHHVFPNLLFSFTDAMSLCHTIMPTSPNSSRAVVRQFGRMPRAGRAYARPVAWTWNWLTATINKHILKEDLTMFQSIQHGLERSSHAGILGRCEERLHAFQQYMTVACSTVAGS